MKRVVTKVGDIYVTPRGQYLQLVAIDYIQLNSDVIVYYGKVNPDDIPNVPIKFYHHNTVSQGVKMGLWTKAGKRDLPDVSKLVFKQYFSEEDVELMDMRPVLLQRLFKRRPYWTTWTPLDKKWKKISYKKGIALDAEESSVSPADELTYRIRHGGVSYPTDWPTQ